jgi:aryl-alcohol dehydrogenase-like predicted oxidoreductase
MLRSVPRATLPGLGDRLPLGKSGLLVSPLCLGITRRETVPAAFAAGVNFFFLSNDLHWSLYAPMMAGIADLLASGVPRDEIVVAGVSYLFEPLFGYLQFNEILDAIPKLERIDVLLAGASEARDFLPRYEKLAAAQRQKMWGCRAIGASFHDRTTARMALCADLLDIAYIRYNPGHPGAEIDLFPHIKLERDCLVYNFKSNSGLVSGSQFQNLGLDARYKAPKATDGYRFALSRPEIDGVLASPGTPEQLTSLAQALRTGPLSSSRAAYMKNLWLLATGQAQIDRE